MAISETSKAPSRTIGLKPLLVGEYSTKSSSTKSDLIDPFFSAAVAGWSPSSARSRIVISIGQGFIEIDKDERSIGPFDVADKDRLHASSSKLVNPERDD